MEFLVLSKTGKGNLLLEAQGEGKGIESKTLVFGGKKAAVVFDTIASVKKPLYLARPVDAGKADSLVGRVLRER
ncbi:MAG: hypothetical protein V1717_02285 [Candidatus Micrarchaeota archaeon]